MVLCATKWGFSIAPDGQVSEAGANFYPPDSAMKLYEKLKEGEEQAFVMKTECEDFLFEFARLDPNDNQAWVDADDGRIGFNFVARSVKELKNHS